MTPTNPKPPSLRESIEKIIRSWPCGDDVVENNGANKILLAVKEAMPDKQPESGGTNADVVMALGWNGAIEEMEKRCE